VYTHIGREGQAHGNLTAIYKITEAWYEWQTGQDRQSGHSRTGVSEQRPNGIFPPVDVVRMLSGSTTSHVALFGGFLYLNTTGFRLHGPRWGPHQTLNRTNNNNI
jgi:hypothetical protein